VKEFTAREHKLLRLLFGALAFSCYGYCLYVGASGFLETRSLVSLAIGVAGLCMLVVQFVLMRNPKWPQRLW
jgi:hypothetical protein